MTEPPRPEEAAEPSTQTPEPRAFGLTTFTIEGRRAPALFVVGWLATLIGGGLAALTLIGIGGIAGTIIWLVGLALGAVGMVLLGGSQTVERRAAGAAYAGPSPVLVFLVVLAASQLAGFAVGLPLSLVVSDVPRPVADLLGVLVQAGVFVGVLRLMVVGAEAMGWAEMGLRRGLGDAVRGLFNGALFAGPVILVTALLAYVVAQVVDAVPASPLPPTGTAAGLLLHLAAGAVVAPVAEELLFRGFALSAWRKTVGDRGAIVRSSIVFVLAHVLFVGGDGFRDAASLATVAGLARVPVAIVLGWLYVRTGSLWAPIGLHAAYNAILIVLGEAAAAG
ncbi:MAG: type II CAAX endopeptidase family protein [Chloroflexota bacterium]